MTKLFTVQGDLFLVTAILQIRLLYVITAVPKWCQLGSCPNGEQR